LLFLSLISSSNSRVEFAEPRCTFLSALYASPSIAASQQDLKVAFTALQVSQGECCFFCFKSVIFNLLYRPLWGMTEPFLFSKNPSAASEASTAAPPSTTGGMLLLRRIFLFILVLQHCNVNNKDKSVFYSQPLMSTRTKKKPSSSPQPTYLVGWSQPSLYPRDLKPYRTTNPPHIQKKKKKKKKRDIEEKAHMSSIPQSQSKHFKLPHPKYRNTRTNLQTTTPNKPITIHHFNEQPR